MTQRYYVASLPKNGGITPLPPTESQHAIRVMRLKIADPITLFDGCGNEAEARVSEITRRECICEADAPRQISRETRIAVHLGIAIPKGDRAKEMIERLTELGVASVTPINSQRTQRPVSGSTIEKLSRVVIEASKQCGRNTLMELHEPKTLNDFFAQETTRTAKRWILHTDAASACRLDEADAQEIVVLVGPEGGWTDEEVDQAKSCAFNSLNLGPRILRIETAAAAIAAICCCKT